MTIRYYFLSGYAAYITHEEVRLTNLEFHDFILNKKEKMRAVIDEAAKYHRKFQDYTDE